ncbi:MAG: hypothetical protein P0Y53_01075 [Candidatus Pseudobacter hemicellulosilyticus]|uniref:Uncharacterized protein n=1 Tax=Candidatus Pseudobacter hemicellulosilyticus TaxID=3121375 RepID=A0AAJ6BHN3_9BACT|nr:MAG: hypothetical protein P0Y53_01075 [Pseudobacter sp.]
MAKTVKISKGTITPTRDTMATLMRSIVKELKTDPQQAKDFAKDPNKFLGDRGLALDVRRELLLEEGFKQGNLAANCGGYSCVSTGNCCWNTKASIADSIIRVYPQMKTNLNKIMINKIV